MSDLIAGVFDKEFLIKKGMAEETIKECVSTPHQSAFQVETWFTILASFVNKMIRSEGYYYAIQNTPACVLVAASLESMKSARVAQGGIPDEEPDRSKALIMITPYVYTMAGLIREDSYSGSKLWNVDTVELANRALKRIKNDAIPLKNVEGKNYVDDKIDMFIDYIANDLKNVKEFTELVDAAKKNYGDIASQLNAGGTSQDNKAVKLFMNTFRKPSDSLIILRINKQLTVLELENLKTKEAKKIAKGVFSDSYLKLESKIKELEIQLKAAELLG